MASAGILLALAFTLLHCGGSPSTSHSTDSTPFTSQAHPVVIVVEENQRYEDVIGNPNMPYLNSLARQFALGANFYADTHPSMPNYFMLTAGDTFGATDTSAPVTTADNVVRELVSAGRTWKYYAEDMPSVGYVGGTVGGYAKDHNPFAFYSDVVDSTAQQANLVPFSQFAADLANGTLPDYAFVVPSNFNNMHNCPAGQASCGFATVASTADAWLQNNMGPLINSSQFKGNGLLVILWDESAANDSVNGGGHIPLVMVGPGVKQGFVSNTLYQHESVLRLSLRVLGISNFPGKAATAPDMSEFFQ